MCVGLVTSADLAEVGLVSCVHVHVFLAVAAVCKSSVTPFYFTFKWFFTCMYPFVNLEIFRPRENLSAARKRTGERFLASVDSHMINQLIFGFEGLLLAGTVLPVAGMVGNFRSTNMINC